MSKLISLNMNNRPRRRRNGQPSVFRNRFSSAGSQEQKSIHIPTIKSNVLVSHTYRFTATNAATNVRLNQLHLLSSCGVVCTVLNTTGTVIAESVRLRRIKIWSPTSTIGATQTCSIEWVNNSAGQLFGTTKEVSDTTTNVFSPAYLSAAPPAGSAASFWNNYNGGTVTNICTLAYGANSVIEIHIDYVLLDDNGLKMSYTFTSGAATLGTMYYINLDNTINTPVVSLNGNY